MMPNDNRNDLGHQVLVEPSPLPLEPTPEELERQRLVRLSHEVKRLYAWLGLLTGLSVLSLGLLGGFAFWLRMQQTDMQKQLATLNAYQAQMNRLTDLEGRVNGIESQTQAISQNITVLNQQVPKGLPTQIKSIQNDLSSVKNQVQKVEANSVTRQQMSQTLQNTLPTQTPVVNPSLPPNRR